MALFSRRKNADSDAAAVTSPADIADDTVAPETPAESVPHVGISVSSFGGLGGGPQRPAAPERPASAESDLPEGAQLLPSGRNHNADGTVALPFAADEPPTEWETAPGLRDNAVLRDALERLPESPSSAQLLGVVRQMLQGHLFLRVRGDAREQAEAGDQLQLGVIRDGDRNFLLAFSSGRSLRDAVQADGDTDTSSFGQPAVLVLRHVLAGDFAGLVVDNASTPARMVVPRDLLERALAECDPEFRLKTLIAADRAQNADTLVADVVEVLRDTKAWVAIGVAGEKDGEPVRGVAEARTADGKRLLQLFTHPLEVVALGRDDQAAPFDSAALVAALRDHGGLDGVLLDPAGPSLRLDRAQLESLLAEA